MAAYAELLSFFCLTLSSGITGYKFFAADLNRTTFKFLVARTTPEGTFLNIGCSLHTAALIDCQHNNRHDNNHHNTVFRQPLYRTFHGDRHKWRVDYYHHKHLDKRQENRV